MFNILMILGIAAAIKPIDVTTAGDQIVSLDMWITLAITHFIFNLVTGLQKNLIVKWALPL